MVNRRPSPKRPGDLDLDASADLRVTPQQKHKAALHVAQRFGDQPELARELLDALGLLDASTPRA